MLARTRAPQAERALAAFKERYPSPAALASEPPEAMAALTANLGLHWRGPLLHRAAGVITSEFGGAIPEQPKILVSLPGVGPYASAAWLSLHRNRRAVIVDNNVARWLCRLEGRPYGPETRRVRWVHRLADELTPARSFRAYNYAVLDFTMLVCIPRKPNCPECPLTADCAYFRGLPLDKRA